MYIKVYNKSSKITCKLINKMGCNQYHLKGKNLNLHTTVYQ